MRELVLDEIETICYNPANQNRWKSMFVNRGDGLVRFYSRKEKGKSGSHAINLSLASRADFETLNDEALLVLLTAMIRQASKQM